MFPIFFKMSSFVFNKKLEQFWNKQTFPFWVNCPFVSALLQSSTAPGSGTLQSGHEPGLQVQQQQLFHKTEPGLYPKTEPAFTAERQQLDWCGPVQHSQSPLKEATHFLMHIVLCFYARSGLVLCFVHFSYLSVSYKCLKGNNAYCIITIWEDVYLKLVI